MQTTRQQILEHLQRHGRATVKELGQLLRLTPTGIRQHLTALERDGLVLAGEERGRVGRPTLVYTLTEKAESLFPKSYDELATALLEEIRASEGSERLYQLLHRVAQRMAESFWERVQGKSLAERVEETALILQEQGCLVDWEQRDSEFLLHEFTCPFSKVAAPFTSTSSVSSPAPIPAWCEACCAARGPAPIAFALWLMKAPPSSEAASP